MIRLTFACLIIALAGCTQPGTNDVAWHCPPADIGPGTYLHGYVVQDGKPAQGAAVQAHSSNASRSASTDGSGCFMLQLDPGSWEVIVAKGGKSTDATLQMREEQYRQYVFKL